MAKKMLFIYNPKAGKGLIRGKLSQVLEMFAQKDYEMTVHPTKERGDAKELIRSTDEKYDLIVCSGGDGTLDEVVTGMIQSDMKVPLGYIPAGSTNDFGGSLAMPKNMIRATEMILKEKNFACDIGRFNEDVFVYIAAFGLFTDVSYETPQDVKNVLGHMAYILEGMRRLPAISYYHMKVSYDDQVIEDDFLFGMVTNSLSVGGFKNITGKHVKLDDGVFEVTLIKRPKNAIEINAIMIALLNRDIDIDAMYCFRASNITFEASEPLAWTLDGEFGGEHKKVEVQNLRQALDIRIG